jgi:hypothetical protein
MQSDVPELEEVDLRRMRVCADCGTSYSIAEYLNSQQAYFGKPYDYRDGCVVNCLTCWLGCGPEHSELEGHLLRECGHWLSPQAHLVIMPVPRMTLDEPIRWPYHVVLYPPGWADLDALNVVPDNLASTSLREFSSAASGIDQQTLERHTLIVFPVRFDWSAQFHTSHDNNLEFLRLLSQEANRRCLNVIRYHQCSLDLPDSLPGQAGQVESNHMMAGVLLYNAGRQEGRIIGGAAFTHFVTVGLGLPVESMDFTAFPQDGEVGRVAEHAMSLYSAVLETNDATAKFVLAIGLMDFLADPFNYTKFEELKKTVARHVAANQAEYLSLLARLSELGGKYDPVNKSYIGYRTRMVHLGERFDQVVPKPELRKALLQELDRYIRAMLDHLIEHSALSWDDYAEIRKLVGPGANS